MPGCGRRAALRAIGALAAASLASVSATERPRRVGYLSGGAGADVLAPQLADLGWVVGRNLHFDVRTLVDGDPAGIAAQAAELVRAKVDALLAFSNDRAQALARATRTIPIICQVSDPVGLGLARTLSRPGGHVTGLSMGVPEQATLMLHLLRTVRPRLRQVVAIVMREWRERNASTFRPYVDQARDAGVSWDFTPIGSSGDYASNMTIPDPEALARTVAGFEEVFASIREPERSAVFVTHGPQHEESVRRIAASAIRHRLATFVSGSDGPDWVHLGCLMHAGNRHADRFRRIAGVLDKVLRGANPAEIPFELPDRTTLVLNRATAKAIGVELSPDILLRATELVG